MQSETDIFQIIKCAKLLLFSMTTLLLWGFFLGCVSISVLFFAETLHTKLLISIRMRKHEIESCMFNFNVRGDGGGSGGGGDDGYGEPRRWYKIHRETCSFVDWFNHRQHSASVNCAKSCWVLVSLAICLLLHTHTQPCVCGLCVHRGRNCLANLEWITFQQWCKDIHLCLVCVAQRTHRAASSSSTHTHTIG